MNKFTQAQVEKITAEIEASKQKTFNAATLFSRLLFNCVWL